MVKLFDCASCGINIVDHEDDYCADCENSDIGRVGKIKGCKMKTNTEGKTEEECFEQEHLDKLSEEENRTTINGEFLLESEAIFLKFVLEEYKTKCRLEENDKLNILAMLERTK